MIKRATKCLKKLGRNIDDKQSIINLFFVSISNSEDSKIKSVQPYEVFKNLQNYKT